MKELESAVVAAFGTMAASGALQKVIEDEIAETVSKCVGNVLGGYSDFAKELEATIKTALHVDMKDLGLVGYNDIVLKIIKRKLEDSINLVGRQRIEKELNELLVNPPAEIKLSVLVDQFKESIDREMYEQRITCIVDTSDSTGLCPGYAHIYMDKESGKGKYSCNIQLDVTPTGEVFGMKISGTDVKNSLFIGPNFGFERSLFQLYAAGTKIIIDAEEVDDYCHDDD